MELDLSGKVVFVTGGGRGIGEAIAQQFVREGATVVIADINPDRAKRTIAALGPNASFIEMDVTSESSVTSAVNKALQDFGKIDVLVNNAGVSNRVKLEGMTYDEFDHVFKVNMYGTFLMTRAVIKHMAERKSGKIVNIAAQSGDKPMPTYSHYSASKAAIIAFTSAVAQEYADCDLNINCICPGAVDTKLWSKNNLEINGAKDALSFRKDIATRFSLGRAQKLEDIANMACYLGSDLTKNISGQKFFVTS